MAASDSHQSSSEPPSGGFGWLHADALRERLGEEIQRAERHGTDLSCLLVVIDNLDQMAREHGEELREQTLGYVAGALRSELRGFDRVGRASARELMVLLPGADGARGEIVARRVLDRLRTIKVEAQGTRSPLRVSVSLAPWRDGVDAAELLAQARAASRPRNGEEAGAAVHGAPEGDAPAR